MDTVSGLQFVNANTFLMCGTDGTMYTADTRDPKIMHHSLQDPVLASHWVFGLKTDGSMSDSVSRSVARLSCTGQVIISDFRNLCVPVKQTQLNLQQTATGSDFLTVTWAPALENHLAVSGVSTKTVCFSLYTLLVPLHLHMIYVRTDSFFYTLRFVVKVVDNS